PPPSVAGGASVDVAGRSLDPVPASIAGSGTGGAVPAAPPPSRGRSGAPPPRPRGARPAHPGPPPRGGGGGAPAAPGAWCGPPSLEGPEQATQDSKATTPATPTESFMSLRLTKGRFPFGLRG